MKRLLIIIILTLSTHAYAADEWTKEDKALQVGVTALTAIDWLQTRAASKQPDKYYENGPAKWFIGKHPSVGAVDRYFFCSVIAKGLATHLLPSSWRAWWQGLCMGASGALIVYNHGVGIRVSKAF